LGQTELIAGRSTADSDQLCGEFWISLASLLRSYTALHGIIGKRQAAVEHDQERITASCDKNWLDLKREGATVLWRRADGQSGTMEFTQAGSLRSFELDRQEQREEEMDMTAERWARDLMQELPQ
jgi:hypothetical protein